MKIYEFLVILFIGILAKFAFDRMEDKTTTSKMRAVIREWGNLVFKSAYAIPSHGNKDVLVRIHAAAINPVDYKAPKIILGPIAGLDFSGVVESVGTSVTQFNKGDEVYGKVKGSLADYAVANPDEIAIKPKSISFAEAAAMPVTYLTSLQALRDYGGLKENGRVLVIGASGGCGIAALQLAKSMGAGHIAAVCSGKNSELVKSHGADEVIDYTKHNVVNYYRGNTEDGEIPNAQKFDVIYDAASNSGAGEDYRPCSAQLLCQDDKEANKKHGQYVAINGGIDMWLRLFTIGQKKNHHLFLTNTNTADLNTLSNLTDNGWNGKDGGQNKLSPIIAKLFSFSAENVEKAFELLKSRRVVGKIVFDMLEGK